MSKREGKEAAHSEEEHEKDMKLFYMAFIGEFRRFNKRMDELNDKVNEVFMTTTDNSRRDGSRTRDIEPPGSEDDEVSNNSMRRRPRREEPRATRHEHDEKKVTLAPLSSNAVYVEQLKSKDSHGDLRIECKEAKSENNKNKGPMESGITFEKNTSEVRSEKKTNFYVKERDVKGACICKRALFLVMFREFYFSEANLDPSSPSVFVSLLKEFPEEMTNRLAPTRGIKQVIFEPGYWVWIHWRKERFPNLRN